MSSKTLHRDSDNNGNSIHNGDPVILNDKAIEFLFVEDIDLLLCGRVENVELKNKLHDESLRDMIVTYCKDDTGEKEELPISWLVKGLPDEVFDNKIEQALKIIIKNPKLYHKAVIKNKNKLEKYLKQYHISFNEGKINVTPKISPRTYLHTNLAKYYVDNKLSMKLEEALEVLQRMQKYASDYKDNEQLMLCYYIFLSYVYDFNNPYKQPLDIEERLAYSLATCYGYEEACNFNINTQDLIDLLEYSYLSTYQRLFDKYGLNCNIIKTALKTAVMNIYNNKNSEKEMQYHK